LALKIIPLQVFHKFSLGAHFIALTKAAIIQKVVQDNGLTMAKVTRVVERAIEIMK
jgi:hypothetical protein